MILNFNKWKSKKYLEYRYPKSKIQFLCEQNGLPEKDLKKEFVTLFKKDIKVLRAYLVRITFDSKNDYLVALCIFLDSTTSLNHKQVIPRIKEISKICQKMLPQEIHLEIIFLDKETETKVLEVCSPFYVSGTEN